MSNLFRKLFGLCEHKWEIIDTANSVVGDNVIVGQVFYLQCEKCGCVKKRVLV